MATTTTGGVLRPFKDDGGTRRHHPSCQQTTDFTIACTPPRLLVHGFHLSLRSYLTRQLPTGYHTPFKNDGGTRRHPPSCQQTTNFTIACTPPHLLVRGFPLSLRSSFTRQLSTGYHTLFKDDRGTQRHPPSCQQTTDFITCTPPHLLIHDFPLSLRSSLTGPLRWSRQLPVGYHSLFEDNGDSVTSSLFPGISLMSHNPQHPSEFSRGQELRTCADGYWFHSLGSGVMVRTCP
jgi:hypothetical protein